MIKFKQGRIENLEGKAQDIIVRTRCPVYIPDLLISGVMIFAGISWLTISAFIKGAACHERAEFKTMMDLGVLTERKKD